LEIGDELML